MTSFSGELEKELSASDDWQSVLRHFAFHQGFALAMILVNNDRLAEACRRDVERGLGISGRTLVDQSPTTPEELVEVCLSLARGKVSRDVGAIWISAVVSEHSRDYAGWYEAFRTAFARLNPQRNRMQQDVQTTVTFVCAPWAKVLLRTMGPDLWSIRSLVTEIQVAEPSPSPAARDVREPIRSKIPEEFAPDPEFALDRAERLRGAEGQVLTLASLLARAGAGFLSQGHYGKAQEALKEELEVRTRVQGEEHPDTLTAMNNVAETIWLQGDYAGARRLLEQMLEMRTRVHGEDHPDTLTSMNNLASTIAAQGDYSAARRLQEQVLEVRTRVLGEEHPDTLSAMNNLAFTLWRQGDYAGARRLEEQVLEVRTRVQGEDHPDTLTSMNNLASTLWRQGDYTGARRLQEQVLAARMRVLGEDHPYTLTSMSNLAFTLSDMGDKDAALGLLRKCLAGLRKVLGEQHPDTIANAESLQRLEGELAGN